jgi:heme-degrading monooxygenase HmoA
VISRHWKGITKPGLADRYIAHLERDTLPMLRVLPGFRRASILRREVAAGTEFQIVTEWQSLEAIKAFAGAHPEVAVVPPAARELMVAFDRVAVHYEIASRYPE